jgi:hypothetical protein
MFSIEFETLYRHIRARNLLSLKPVPSTSTYPLTIREWYGIETMLFCLLLTVLLSVLLSLGLISPKELAGF